MRKCFIPMTLTLLLILSIGACGESSPAETPTVAPEATQTPSPVTLTPEAEPPTASDMPEPEAMLPLVILEPQDEAVVDTSRITVSGSTRSDAVVSINGTITHVDSQGDFSGEVNLDIGPNLIEVIASDFYGNEESVVLAVVYAASLPLTVEEAPIAADTELPRMFKSNSDGSFFLEITSPEQSEVIVDSDSITVAGKTTVDAMVSVNDAFVEINMEGAFESTVQLEEGVNLIEVVASIASDEQLDQVITVIYAP